MERFYLFHRLVAALNFGDRKVKGNMSSTEVYELCDMVCDEICTENILVVSATIPGFNHSGIGKFGRANLGRDGAVRMGFSATLALNRKTTIN